MNETAYVNKVKKLLQQRGAYFEKIWGGGMQAAGIPDVIICYRGVFIGFEAKVNNNKPSPLQVAKINLIREAGGVGAIVWDRLEPVEYILDTIDNYLDGSNVLNITNIDTFNKMRVQFNTKEDSYDVR